MKVVYELVDINRSKIELDTKDIDQIFQGPISGTVIVMGDKSYNVSEDFDQVRADWERGSNENA